MVCRGAMGVRWALAGCPEEHLFVARNPISAFDSPKKGQGAYLIKPMIERKYRQDVSARFHVWTMEGIRQLVYVRKALRTLTIYRLL